jgi:hypothetical protein
LASVVQVAPPLFEKWTNERPVAKHTLVVGQLTPFTSYPELIVWVAQVAPPSDVLMAAPWYPTPTHVVGLAQLSE